jgi:hypothetical protein
MMRISKHYLCPGPTASKNHRCFFSQIFAFPLETRKFAKSVPRPVVAALSCPALPGTQKAPVDKPAAAQ